MAYPFAADNASVVDTAPSVCANIPSNCASGPNDLVRPQAQTTTNLELDLDGRDLAERALALGLAVEVVSFGEHRTQSAQPRALHFTNWHPSARQPHTFNDFELTGQDGRSGTQRQLSRDLETVLAPVDPEMSGGGSVITVGLYDRGACLVTLPGYRKDTLAPLDPIELAAALRLPLDSVQTVHGGGQLAFISFVVDAASLDAAFAARGMRRDYAQQVREDDRLILPGSRLAAHRMGSGHGKPARSWGAPAGDDTFLAALAGPPAQATYELVRAICDDASIPALLRENAERQVRAARETAQEAPWVRQSITRATFMAKPPQPDYVSGLIPHGQVGIVWGVRGVGKSTALLSIGALLALGRTFDGQSCQRHLVLYVSGDDSPRDLGVRAEAIRQRFGLTDADPFYVECGAPQLANLAAEAAFAAYVEELANRHPGLPILIILDTLSAVLGGGGVDDTRRDVKPVLAACHRLARRFEATIAITQHPIKKGTECRGDAVILDDTAFTLAVSMDRAGQIIMTCERLKTGPEGATLTGRHVTVTVPHDDGTLHQANVIEWTALTPPGAAKSVSPARAAPKVPTPCQHRLNLLAAFEKAFAGNPIKHFDEAGQVVEAARFTDVRTLFEANYPDTNDAETSTIRGAWRRARIALTDEGELAWTGSKRDSVIYRPAAATQPLQEAA